MIVLAAVALILAGVLGTLGFLRWERIQQRKLAIEERRAPAVVAPDPMPPDLLELASQESEAWARADTLKAMQEHYAATGSWETVRQMMAANRFGSPWGSA